MVPLLRYPGQRTVNVAAALFQAYIPAHPGPKTPTLTVYVPRGRFDGTRHPALNVRVVFAVND